MEWNLNIYSNAINNIVLGNLVSHFGEKLDQGLIKNLSEIIHESIEIYLNRDNLTHEV